MNRFHFLAARNLIAVLADLVILLGAAAQGQTFSDDGFVVEEVVTLPPFAPVGMVFAPDGRMFIWEKSGIIRIFKDGVLLPTPFLDISGQVNRFTDRGLLGVALDPSFATNGHVYLAYVYEGSNNPDSSEPRTSRGTRVTADPANPDRALPDSEIVLLGKLDTPPCDQHPPGSDCITADNAGHTLDWLRFGADGKLYVSNGDGATAAGSTAASLRAQDLNSYSGKLLRVNPDGTAPGDNPFDDGTDSIRSKVLSYGLRNPYRFSLHPTSGEPFIGDVGWFTFEEINRGAGKNFGWPCYEGPEPEPRFQARHQLCRDLQAASVTLPMYSYPRDEGVTVILGPFYTGTQFPAQYHGSLFYADYVGDYIRRVTFDARGNVVDILPFATGLSGAIHLEQAPDGSLFYLSWETGQIRRIRFVGDANRAPVATGLATPPFGHSPVKVNFEADGSADPDGDPVTFTWDFGDGDTATGPAVTHTYVAEGVKKLQAALTVTDDQGASTFKFFDVTVGSLPPTPAFNTPSNGAIVRPGQRIQFAGLATDPDEALDDSDLSWRVILHHDTHTHLVASGAGGTGSFPIEQHDPVGTFAYEVVLTAIDSSGLSKSQSIMLPAVQPDFTISGDAERRIVRAGQPVQFTISFAALGGNGAEFNDDISFECSGLPAGSTCTFSPDRVKPGNGTGSVTLTINTPLRGTPRNALGRTGSFTIYGTFVGLLALVFGGSSCLLRAKRRHWRGMMLGMALGALLLSMACGQVGVKNRQEQQLELGIARPSEHSVTVIAKSGTIRHETKLTLAIVGE